MIPILLDHASMPGESELPTSLAPLADYNAIDVDQGRDFHHHVDELIKGIEFHLERTKTAPASPSSLARVRQPELERSRKNRSELRTHPSPIQIKSPSRHRRSRFESGSSPVASEPQQPQNAEPESIADQRPKAPAMSNKVIESEPLRTRSTSSVQGQDPADSGALAAPPKRRNFDEGWLYAAGLLLLVLWIVYPPPPPAVPSSSRVQPTSRVRTRA